MEFKFKIAFLYFKERLLLIMMRTLMLLCCTLTFGFGPISGLSQNAKIVIDSDQVMSVEHIFKLIKKQTDYRFIYRSDVIQSAPDVQLKKGVIKAGKLLDKILTPISCTFEFTENNTVIVQRQENVATLTTQETITIKGVIKDEIDEPMVGVNIIIKGTDKGVSSDFDGNYAIKVPSPSKGVTLVYTYVGYEKQEIIIGDDTTINVQLKADLSGLDEVVVIGYGSIKRKDVTGAITRLNPAVLEHSTSPTIGSMIQGQLPGVQVLTGAGEPGTTVRIRIRGDATINDGADPLIVIDGVPMPNDFNLNDINPNDVKALDILKGASASAIYGSRASAGVLEITTKRGNRYTKPQISYSYNYGVKSLSDDIRSLNSTEFKDIFEEGLLNYVIGRFDVRGGAEAARNYVRPSNNTNYYDLYLPDDKFGSSNTNWPDLMISSTITQDHHLSLRGGDKKAQYSFSFGKTVEDGMLLGSDYNRNSITMNYDQHFSDNLKVGFSLMGGSSDRNGTVSIGAATNMRPDIPAYNEDGSYHIFTYEYFGTNQVDNPLILANDVTNNTKGMTISASPYVEFSFLNNFKFTSRYNYYLNLGDQTQYYPRTTRVGQNYSDATGSLIDTENENSNTTFTNYLSYLNRFNDHDISSVFGIEFNQSRTEFVTERYLNFADDKIQNAIWQAATYRWASGDLSETSAVGYYGRVNYKFKDKYLLTTSFRVDGSSRFAPKNRYGFFPSVALGYIVSDEAFFADIKKTLNLLKVRVSAGKTGNDRVGAYNWLAQYQSGVDYMNMPGVRPTSLGNDNLKWESSTEYNFGLDFGFMENNRIRGSFEIYKKDVKNMLIGIPMAPSTGVSSVFQNFGDLTNKGVELGLSGILVQQDNLTWELGANISKNKNVLTKLGIDRASTTSGATWLSYYVIEEGQPLGLIYGYKTDGIFQNWDEVDAAEALNPDRGYQELYTFTMPGDIKFVDTSGDGYVSAGTGKDDDEHEDRRVIGKTQPDFWGGLYTSLQYKGLRLDVRGTFQKGGVKYWKYGEAQFQMNNISPNNVDALALQRWTPDNPNAKYPAFRNSYYTNKISDFWLYDASFLKIQEINLSYNLSDKILDKVNFISGINIFATVNNVFTFTKYPGYNVESYSSNPIEGSMMDYSSYPNERTFKIGARIIF